MHVDRRAVPVDEAAVERRHNQALGEVFGNGQQAFLAFAPDGFRSVPLGDVEREHEDALGGRLE